MRTHNSMRKPNGRRWMQVRAAVFATYGRTCHICGHDGSNQVDHLVPQAVAPQLGWELSNLRPAHGAPGNKCPVCGIACNQARQAGVIVPKPASPQPARKPGGRCTLQPYCDGMAGHPFNCGRRW